MTAPGEPAPFRAGRTAGETPAAHVSESAAATIGQAVAGPHVLLADVSEFQAEVTDALYLAWSKAIVIRAAYGTRTDKAWFGGQRRVFSRNG